MPRKRHDTPSQYGGWTYLRPLVQKLAAKWPRAISSDALGEQFLSGVLVCAAKDPANLGEKGWAKIGEVYRKEPDWILAVLQLYRREIVNPTSPRRALLALLSADPMIDKKDEEVLAEAAKEFPGLHIPSSYVGGNVSNARSTIKTSLNKSAKT